MNKNICSIIGKFINVKYDAYKIGQYGLVFKLGSVKNYAACMLGACKSGQTHIISRFLKEGKRVSSEHIALAARKGHIDIIKLFIASDVKFGTGKKVEYSCVVFYSGLDNAVEYGHLEIAKLLINRVHTEHWNKLLSLACYNGSAEMIEYLISLGVKSWNNGLFGACRGGHLEIINSMINKGANDFSGGLTAACMAKKEEIADLMLAYGATCCAWCNKPEHNVKPDRTHEWLIRSVYF